MKKGIHNLKKQKQYMSPYYLLFYIQYELRNLEMHNDLSKITTINV